MRGVSSAWEGLGVVTGEGCEAGNAEQGRKGVTCAGHGWAQEEHHGTQACLFAAQVWYVVEAALPATQQSSQT